MAIIYSKPYLYGADRDGNRGEWRKDETYISDISGKDLSDEDVYTYDEMHMSKTELINILFSKILSEDGELMYEYNGKDYSEDEVEVLVQKYIIR